MGIQIINGGFLTTIQDMGRYGYQETGMSVSGVMDTRAGGLWIPSLPRLQVWWLPQRLP